MGLDMFAYRVNKAKVIDDFDFKKPEGAMNEDWYWRKNRHLHNFMFIIWNEKKGGTETRDHFNCEFVRLDEDDLDRLEQAINNRKLPDDHGFFFGDFEYDDQQAADDLQFVKEARQSIRDGDAIYYSSWW